MEAEFFLYCQACDARITVDQLALLNAGKCPTCGEITGFSTAPKSENDGFADAVVLNDTDFLNQ